MRRKVFPSEAAAQVQYAAINGHRGYPSRGVDRDGNPAGPASLPAAGESPAGWTVEAYPLADGPGPTVAIILPEGAAEALNGVEHGGVTIDLSGHVDHPVSERAQWAQRERGAS